MNKRILITGCNGFIGSKIIKYNKNFECFGIARKIKNSEHFYSVDIREYEKVEEIIKKINPFVLIHTAALTNVDYCEENPEEAYAINSEGTKNLALACKKINAKMIYISTDYIFDGNKGNYSEEDIPNPINIYGKSKLKGEYYVKEILENFLIFRISVPYGFFERKLNFVTWVIENLKNNKEIKAIDDQFNSPTYADNLAKSIIQIIEDKKDSNGIYHLSGSERISRYEFAERICKIFNLDKNLIKKVKSNELNWKAKRPIDSSLNIEKAKKELKVDLYNINQGLNEMYKIYTSTIE